jgi:MFS family permease
VSPASRCRDWPDRLATLAVFFANGLGLGAWAAAIPALKARLALSDGQLSVALFSFACGAFISMPLAGWIGSRVRTGHATLAVGIPFAASLVIPAFTSVLPMLCGAAAMAGACTGAVDVLMNVHASSIERRWRAPIVSSFHAAFSVGGMAAAVLGGSLAPRGVMAELGAVATLCAVVVLAAAFVMRAGDVAPAGRSLAVPDRARLTLGLLAMLSLMIEGAVADWSGTLLAQGGADIRSTTFGYGAFSCAMAGGRLLGDWLVGRFGAATIVRCGGALAAAGLALVAWVQTPLAGAVGFGLVGLGLANVVPTVFSATGRMSTSVAAAVVTAGYAGLLLGPVAIGSVATAANLSWGMAVLAVAAAAVSTLAARSGFFAPRICHGS